MKNCVFYIAFVFFALSSCIGVKKSHQYNNGEIEILKKQVIKDYGFSKVSLIKIEFYSTQRKMEKRKLMGLSINNVDFLTDAEIDFERNLAFGRKYEFRFYGTGFQELKKKIKIEMGFEYLIKVFLDPVKEAEIR